MAGKFKFDPCGSCCAVEPCCLCDLGSTPEQIEVTISGVVEGSCGSCADINGTYICTRGSGDGGGYCSGLGANCTFFYAGPTKCITTGDVYVVLWGSSGNLYIWVYFGLFIVGPALSWLKNLGSWPRSCNFIDEEITVGLNVGSVPCDHTGSTCKITALP